MSIESSEAAAKATAITIFRVGKGYGHLEALDVLVRMIDATHSPERRSALMDACETISRMNEKHESEQIE